MVHNFYSIITGWLFASSYNKDKNRNEFDHMLMLI